MSPYGFFAVILTACLGPVTSSVNWNANDTSTCSVSHSDGIKSSYYKTSFEDQTGILLTSAPRYKESQCGFNCINTKNCTFFQFDEETKMCSLYKRDSGANAETLYAGEFKTVDWKTNYRTDTPCHETKACIADRSCYGDTCTPTKSNFTCECPNPSVNYGMKCDQEFIGEPAFNQSDNLYTDMNHGASHLTIGTNKHFLVIFSLGEYDGSNHKAGYSYVFKYDENEGEYKRLQYLSLANSYWGSGINAGEDNLIIQPDYYDRTRSGWQYSTYHRVFNYVDDDDMPKFTDWAHGKTAYESTTAEYSPGVAVDGDKETCSNTNSQGNAWWMVDLGEEVQVLSLMITNRRDNANRLADFDVGVGGVANSHSSFSTGDFQICEQFHGTVSSEETVTITCHPIRTGRWVYIRLRGTNHLSLCEVEVYAARIVPYIIAEGESMMRTGLIPDASITASTTHSSCPTSHARIDSGNGWCASGGRTGDWIQVDLGIIKTVHKVVTRGRHGHGQRITSFTLEYSTNGVDFDCYSDDPYPSYRHQCKVFRGNFDYSTYLYHALRNYVRARYIRFIVESYNEHPSMRFDVWTMDQFVYHQRLRINLSGGDGVMSAISLKRSNGDVLLTVAQHRSASGNEALYKADMCLYQWHKELKIFINIQMLPAIWTYKMEMSERVGDVYVESSSYAKQCCHTHDNAMNKNYRIDNDTMDVSTVTTLGPSIVDLTTGIRDLATSFSLVNKDFEFPEDGEVLGWEFLSIKNNPIYLNVLRPVDDDACQYKVVGRIYYEDAPVGIQKLSLTVKSRVVVQKGDRIGFSVSGASVIPYEEDASNDICSVSGVVSAGSTYTYSANWGKRRYAFRAIWRPFGYTDEYITPYPTCEQDLLVLSCPADTWIEIKDAFYGKSDESICYDADPLQGDCSLTSALTKVKESCEGKVTCSLTVNNGNFGGDPCSGITKYASATYRCVNRPHALGLEMGQIANDKITSKTDHGSCSKNLARLHSSNSWCSTTNDVSDNNGDWIQYDLTYTYYITKIATQGRHTGGQWVTSYEIWYSVDGVNFECYKKRTKDGCKIFKGNTDYSTVVDQPLQEPVIAKIVRFRPKSYSGHMSMRAEVYGYRSDMERALGMENLVIPDDAITAPSFHGSDPSSSSCVPRNGRLNSPAVNIDYAAWCANLTYGLDQWLQINLGSKHLVSRVATQGRGGNCCPHWVTAYTLSFSEDGTTFDCYKDANSLDCKEFSGNVDQTSVVYNQITPVSAQYVRFHPVAWNNYLAMRVEVYGYTPGSVPSKGPTSLGLSSMAFPDSGLSAYNADGCCPAIHGRLNFRETVYNNAWASAGLSTGYYFIFDFGEVFLLYGLATQGRSKYTNGGGSHTQWVTQYKIYYTDENLYWDCFVEHSGCKTFTANSDEETIVTNHFPYPILARYIRVYTQAWHNHASMRLEAYGHKAGYVPIPIDMNNCQGISNPTIEYKGDHFMACPYHRTNYDVKFYKWNHDSEIWEYFQSLSDGFPHRHYGAFITPGGVNGEGLYYFQPVHSNGGTHNCNSAIYKWNGSSFAKISKEIAGHYTLFAMQFQRENEWFLYQNNYLSSGASGSTRYKVNQFIHKWT